MLPVVASPRRLYIARFRALLAAVSAWCLACAGAHKAHASTSPIAAIADMRGDSASLPVRIDADKMEYDRINNTVTAEGEVEIHRGEDIVLAQKIIYYRNTDVIYALGGVNWLRGEDGTVIFAENAQIKNASQEGEIEEIQAEFLDKSRLQAQYAEKKGQQLTVKNVAYTPCPLCVGDKKISPDWSVTADSAILDEAEETVRYKNMYIRVKDTPVFYLPYFRHPMPGAKRKTGFLTPSYKNDSVFGFTVETPFYYNIKPQMDLTVTPVYSAEEGVAASGTFRHLQKDGYYELTASGAYPRETDNTNGARLDGREFRGHVEGQGQFRINDRWQSGFTLERATDDTYMRRYGISDRDVLTSRSYARFLTENSWLHAQTISFQSLEAADDPAETPLILPEVRYVWNGDKGAHLPFTELSAEGGALALTRDIGSSTSRLTAALHTHTPFTTAGGHQFALDTRLRTDAYIVDTDPRPGSGETGSREELFRMVPEATLGWSYPLIRREEDAVFTLEPLAKLTFSPNGGNPGEITNEDSQDVEFNASNLFSDNRFSGYDRIESGARFAYGVKAGVTHEQYGQAGITVGQNSRLRENKDFDALSGLRDRQSDYVARAFYRNGVGKDGKLALDYETRTDADDYSLTSQALYAALDVKDIRAETEYVSTNDVFATDGAFITSREALLTRVSAPVPYYDNWRMSATAHRDLANGQWVSARGELEYAGDCYGLSLIWNKEFTSDRDIEAASTFAVKLKLRNFTP